MKSSFLGLILGVGIISYAVFNTGNDSAIFMNWISILIVFGGTFSVALITYGLKNTFKIFSLYFKVFKTSSYTKLAAIEEVVNTSKALYNNHGGISNHVKNETLHPFFGDGLRLVHNKFDRPKLKKILSTMVHETQHHHENQVEQLNVIAKYPPAFGMMGTIIGLVAVLNQIADAAEIANIGPSMAVALITTLYGIFLANYIIQPIGDNFLAKSYSDIKTRTIIAEGVLLISQNEDPVYVREMLLGYLMPGEREQYRQNNQSSVHNVSEAA